MRNIIKENLKRVLNEIIEENSDPSLKYYAFDWDDNLMFMPTKIYVKDNNSNSVGMSTEDFAEHRTDIGVNDFEYDGHMITGFDNEPFRDFKESGDKQFIKDAMIAPTGPAWNDFVEAVNNGSIFSIITARGHTPSVLKTAVYKLIMSNKNGLDNNKLISNLKKYRELADENSASDDVLIKEYLDLCKFHPVTYGQGSAANPEELKITAMSDFVRYVKLMAHRLQKKAFMKNKISNYFNPSIGFSDDDERNVKSMKNHFKDDDLRMYLTKNNNKTEY
jgi:hypothetical protein